MTGGSDALFGSPRQPERRRGLQCSCSVLGDVDTAVMGEAGVCVSAEGVAAVVVTVALGRGTCWCGAGGEVNGWVMEPRATLPGENCDGRITLKCLSFPGDGRVSPWEGIEF